MERRIIDFLNVVVGTGLGLYLVLLAVTRADALRQLSFHLSGSAGWLALSVVVGLALVGANVWLLVRDWRAGGFRRTLRIVTDEGANELSLPSLEALLVNELKTQPDVIDAEVVLEPRGDDLPLLCHLGYKLKRQENVIRRADQLKKRVKDAFLRLLPEGVAIEIAGEVRDLVTEPPPVEKANEFSGPVYPPDGGDGV